MHVRVCVCVRVCLSQVKAALVKLEKAERDALDTEGSKRKYNSLDAMSESVTAEEMEAWRLKKARGDDPLTQAQAAGAGGTNGYDLL